MSTDPADAAGLLGQVADALNDCEQAGLPVKLKHGIVTTAAGYVLPAAADGTWVARTLNWTEFAESPSPWKSDEDD